MANKEHLALLKKGVAAWNAWRRNHYGFQPDLSRADFRGMYLLGADLSHTYLVGTNFSQAHLDTVNFLGSELDYTNFQGASLVKANLTQADLRHANLRNANLQDAICDRTYFHAADLTQADFARASLHEGYFHEAILSQVNFQSARLVYANLQQANLDQANLSHACLENAELNGAELYGAELMGANLTGACIEECRVDAMTHLESVICDYVYLKRHQQSRFPQDRKLQPGELSTLFQQSGGQIVLEFTPTIHWKAFAEAFSHVMGHLQPGEMTLQRIEPQATHGVKLFLQTTRTSQRDKIQAALMHFYDRAAMSLPQPASPQAPYLGAAGHLQGLDELMWLLKQMRHPREKAIATPVSA
ncbi:MAG: pentapeptide repeat-containing protein [Synechococcales bacterium]|nr:pentapeptide repeat-containing protein [Synechococcales bacterium]